MESKNSVQRQRHPKFTNDEERGKYYAEYKRNYYQKNRERIKAKIQENYEKRMQERIQKAIAEGRAPPRRKKQLPQTVQVPSTVANN
jgi:phosphoglucomutase